MSSHRSILQVLFAILGSAGIILIPLPFVEGESPLSQFGGSSFNVWELALPYFLAVPATLFTIHWIISGKLSRFEGVAGYVAGTFSALVTMSGYLPVFNEPISWPNGVQEWAGLLPGVILIAGGYMTFRNWRKGLPHGLNAWVWLQVAYLANCLLCLMIFWGGLRIGGYLALLTAIAYVIQIILLCRRRVTVTSVPATS